LHITIDDDISKVNRIGDSGERDLAYWH